MIKKELLIGFVVSIIFTALGFALSVLIFSVYKELTFATTLKTILEQDRLWALLALSSIPSLLAFHRFLNTNRIYRARGVLISTFLMAFIVYYLYLF